MQFLQHKNQAIDVLKWPIDEQYTIYPEGAREKTAFFSPIPHPFSFLENNRRYLFKRSNARYLEQFWIEIFAYLLGEQMNIEVPKAFVAYNSENSQCGALIRWFLNKNQQSIPGGDLCQRFIVDYDRPKGTKHNFQTVIQIMEVFDRLNFKTNWQEYWAKTFLFDALIGNTDRHHNNWNIILTATPGTLLKDSEFEMSPIFDNGTSMGHERFPKKFNQWKDADFKNYISQGTHHMKWRLEDDMRLNHIEFIKRYLDLFPDTFNIMLNCIRSIENQTFVKLLDHLTSFNIPVKLSHDRKKFMLELLNMRYEKLKIILKS